MYYYKSIIQYAGTSYAGFQWQNGAPSIQDELNKSLVTLIQGKFSTMAASRTDTGVHAFHQVVKITSEEIINIPHFLDNFNQALPQDIQCLDIESCAGDFRPSVHSLSKEYRYFFTNKTRVESEDSAFIANIANPLNLELIEKCLDALIGTHDFCNFYSAGSNVKSTVRAISKCELTLVNPHEILKESNLFQISANVKTCYELKIEANGFLKQMIRHIVSALWMVGSGKISYETFISLLSSPKKEKQLWKVAPPNGLFLYKIIY